MTHKQLITGLKNTLAIYEMAYREKWGPRKKNEHKMENGLCTYWYFSNLELRHFMDGLDFVSMIMDTTKIRNGYMCRKGSLYPRIVFLKTLIKELE